MAFLCACDVDIGNWVSLFTPANTPSCEQQVPVYPLRAKQRIIQVRLVLEFFIFPISIMFASSVRKQDTW